MLLRGPAPGPGISWQTVPKVNFGAPLSSGLLAYWVVVGQTLMSAVPGIKDFAAMRTPEVFSMVGGPHAGPAIGSTSAVTGVAQYPDHSYIEPTSAMTVMWSGRLVSNLSNNPGLITVNASDGGNNGWGIVSYSGSARPFLRVGSAWADRTVTAAANEYCSIGFTYDGSTFWSVKNGVRANSQAISGSITTALGTLQICAQQTVAGNGATRLLAIWNRALGTDELMQFYNNPYSVLRPNVVPLFAPPAAAAFLARQGLNIPQAVNRASTY